MSPYNRIELIDLDPFAPEITRARAGVLADLRESERHMEGWFQDLKWQKNAFTFCTLIREKDGPSVALSACKIMPDRTMKILCHYYMIRSFRSAYRSLSQTDIIPWHVKRAREEKLAGVWYTIHAFDRRHERLKQSVLRSLNGGRVREEYQPYLNSFRHEGQITYNHVRQDKFYFPLENHDGVE